MNTCIYAGTFDPTTIGHMWMINQGSKLFDELIVAIGTNPAKKPMFTYEERKSMLTDITMDLRNVTITEFPNTLLIKYAELMKAQYILRGIRNATDFEYELQMRQINGDLCKDIQTVFLTPPRELVEISSSLVKSLVGFDGWEDVCKYYVPGVVLYELRKKEMNK